MYNGLRSGIVMANYNKAEFITEALDALYKQDIKPDWICIVDDHSSDNSVETVETYFGSKTFPLLHNGINVMFIKSAKNGWASKTRNICVNYLIDKVDILFVNDSDDIYYPSKIKKTLDVFIKYPKMGLVYTDYDHLYTKDNKKSREWKESHNLQKLYVECIVTNNSAYHVQTIKKIGLYDETLCSIEDYDLWLRIAEFFPVYHIPEALYLYRVHESNLSVVTPKDKWTEQYMKVMHKARERGMLNG